MRDLAEVLLKLDNVTQEKESLMSQLSEMTVQLEQERSKVHALQQEFRKLQNGSKKRLDSFSK